MVRISHVLPALLLAGLAAPPLMVAACQQPPPDGPAAQDPVAPSTGAVEQTAIEASAGAETGAAVSAGSTTAEPTASPDAAAVPVATGEMMPKADCQKLLDDSDALFRPAIASASRRCQKDEDCEFAVGGCRPRCGALAIARSDKARYEKSVAAAAAKCAAFDEGLCSAALALPIPTCSPYRPSCVGGSCEARVATEP